MSSVKRQDSIRTEQAYVDWIKLYIFFNVKSPLDSLGGV